MSIQKLGPGRYRVWLFLGRNVSGKQIRRSEVVNGTKADAEKRERELRRALDTGTFVDPKAGTVAEFMVRWLESVREKKSERTYVRYEQMARNQIVPDLGHLKLPSSRGDSHPPALTEPGVNLSIHPARAVQPTA